MKEPSELLKKMFETDRWQDLLDNATEKEIDLKTIKELCFPKNRMKLYKIIVDDEYNIFPPHLCLIPKDNPGEFREVYVNEARDRIVLTLINDCLCELFGDMIHKQCKSYQKGIGTQKVVKEISAEIVKLDRIIDGRIGWKGDFSKYFDNVKIEVIDDMFNRMEERLGFERGTEPVINLLRRYYHQDWYFDVDGNLQHHYQGLKQGCATASILANICLYELDEYMSKKYRIFYRYSDDFVVIDKDTSNVIDEVNSIISKYGVTLNPKKVEPLYSSRWFKFLGFNIKGNMITLSKNRVKKFQKEVEKRSIDIKKKYKNFTGNQARKRIIKFLYEGEFSWGSSCLGTINVEPDIQELNKFIMDCIRACDTGKLKIGGLGSVMNLDDRTIMRGRGKNVRANREKTGYIEDYLSVKCLSNNMKMSPVIFEVTVRNMKG